MLQIMIYKKEKEMKEIKWTAGNGKEVRVYNKTEEINIADHTHTNKVDEIVVELDSNERIYQGLIDFENGKAIKTMGITIRIPADKEAEVVEMINAHETRWAERNNKRVESEKKYNEHYNTVKNAMEE